jgi:hypothetical protein
MNYINPLSLNVTLSSNQSPMTLLSGDTYTKIEEIFSVFDKSILNQFEQEFLNFCKPNNTLNGALSIVGLGQSPIDTNANFKNFQALMRTLMTVPAQNGGTEEQYFKDTAVTQAQVFASNIKSFMEYDVLLRYGNPGNYNRRVFNSFINDVIDPINFGFYQKGTLPTLGGNISLAQSQASYSLQWAALKTEVGFSTIENLVYTDRGSYITDFFVDNNVAFTVQNITLLSQLIKIYATRKLLDPSITSVSFKDQITQFISNGSNLQSLIINDTMSSVRAKLPEQSQLPEKVIQSVIDGQQSKVENYDGSVP